MSNNTLISELQSKFGYDTNVTISDDSHGLALVSLETKSGARAQVYLNGGQLSSFKNGLGEEYIFMSTKAIYQQGKPLRGGIPICWPQFGPGKLPQHGFARSSQWTLTSTFVDGAASHVGCELTLEDSEETRKTWPHSFQLKYKISVDSREGKGKEQLWISFEVTNRDEVDKQNEDAFSFTTALHTYFKINDVKKTTVVGLKGKTFVDKVKGGAKFTEEGEKLSFSGETDRVYLDVPDEVHIVDESVGLKFAVKKEGFQDTVVWNLWDQKAKETADMGDDDWPSFVCVETAQVGNPIQLTPGQSWSGKVEIKKL